MEYNHLIFVIRKDDKQKFEVTLYSLHSEMLDDNYPSDIVYHHIYGHGKWGDYFRTFIYQYFSPSLFYRLFIKGKYDTEVAFIEGYSTRIVSGSTNPHSRKIAWVHIDLQNNHWTDVAFHSREEEGSCYRKFDVVVAVSETTRLATEKLFPNIRLTMCLYNPINSKEILWKSRG